MFGHYYHVDMYKQQTINNKELIIFGKKVFEETTESITVFPHRFINNKERQPVLAETETITRKFFGIPIIKAKCTYDTGNFLPS